MAKNSDTSVGEAEVGYGRPPANHRFEKGRSGNPKGRPRGTHNFGTDVKQMLNMPVPLEREGGRRKISTQQASLLRLREKALKGDARALDRLIELARQHNGETIEVAASDELAQDDQAILDAFEARIRGKIEVSSAVAEQEVSAENAEDP